MSKRRRRVLLAIDRPGWCFEGTTRELVRHLGLEYRFIVRQRSAIEPGDYDVAIAHWWGDAAYLRTRVRAARFIVCVYDAFTWESEEGRTRLAGALAGADVVVAGSEAIASALGADRPTRVIEDGVDCTHFQPSPLPRQFTVGWCGNADFPGRDLKGTAMIEAACRKAGVHLQLLDAKDGCGLPYDKMPGFYEGLSVYLSASRSEATPRPVLEAMASGRPVVTTRVGITEKLLIHDESGFFVERSVDAMADALARMREMPRRVLSAMGDAGRGRALLHDWSERMPLWRNVLRLGLR